MSLEQLGRLLLLANEAREMSKNICEKAGELEDIALTLYSNREAGVVAGVEGVLSYADYRKRLATRLRAEATDTQEFLDQLERRTT